MRSDQTYDVVVLGGGPVGENVAQYATEHSGLTAVLVERELVGGECSYYACMPSKALLRPIEVASTAAHLGGLSRPHLDVAALLARRDEWVSHYDDSGQVDWARGAGIDVVRGHGRITGPRKVEVTRDGEGPVVLHARHAVVIATGSSPVVPEPYAAALPWGSRDATGVVEVPERLAIVGGGVVACEAATWMAALGSHVTMLVRGDRLLGGAEPFASEAVLEALRGAGVDVRLGVEVSRCRRDDARDTGLGRVHGGTVHLLTTTTSAGTGAGAPTGDQTSPAADGEAGAGDAVEADELLVATGRRPRLEGLGLETVGLDAQALLRHTSSPSESSRGEVPDWLLAVGDASGEAPLTHWGKYRARVLGQHLAARATGAEPEPVPDDVPVPQVVFTDPQVAWVGLTAAAARERFGEAEVEVVEVPFTGAAGAALLRDDASGTASLVVDRGSRTVVGATFVGPDAGELLHAATIAIVGRVLVSVLRHGVPSYPTASELWLRLLEGLPLDLRR